MIGLSLLLASAAVTSTDLPSLGEPIGNIAYWINNDDWTNSRANGAVRFKVIFNQKGIPDGCLIEKTTGNKEVERIVCSLVSKRFRFRESFDSQGAPVNRILVRAVAMSDRVPASIMPQALFGLTMRGIKGVSRISVVVDVTTDGSIIGCSSAEKEGPLGALGKAACRSVTSLWQPLQEVGSDGKPMRYVRDVPIEIKHEP